MSCTSLHWLSQSSFKNCPASRSVFVKCILMHYCFGTRKMIASLRICYTECALFNYSVLPDIDIDDVKPSCKWPVDDPMHVCIQWYRWAGSSQFILGLISTRVFNCIFHKHSNNTIIQQQSIHSLFVFSYVSLHGKGSRQRSRQMTMRTVSGNQVRDSCWLSIASLHRAFRFMQWRIYR